MEKDAPDYAYLALDGVENCMAALKDIENGKIHHCFIEMSACAGSCIGGPVMEKYHRSPVRDYASISRYAGNKDFPVDQPAVQYMKKPFGQIVLEGKNPSEKEITDILHNMGKYKPEDELNCGSCGYNTCREKAIAVFEGKAEISMCLPFLKEKAESLSNTIVRCTPNAVLVLNSNLEVQQLNNAALRILNLHSAHDILGDQVVRILEPDGFIQVRDTGRGIFNERVYLAEYDRFVDRTIVSAEEGRMILCIMKDVTEEENARREREEISRNTVDVADRVVEKQMRIVQEIASLLGETAAETKIALYKLKESITNE